MTTDTPTWYTAATEGGRMKKKNQRYTSEFKAEAVKLVTEQGLSQRRIAQQLHVSRDTVQRTLRQVARARVAGTTAATPAPRPRRRRSLETFEDVIGQLLERVPLPEMNGTFVP